MRRKRFLSVVSFAVVVFCCGVFVEQVPAAKPPTSERSQIDLLQRNVSAEAANADLEMLQKIMVEMHPGL
ncbi:MAG: hypothetical protein HN882_09065, partial [Planctomycetaceae bacterium]|nr:hypothetical protein [Planctomycetaceae bacterium]